MIVKRSAESMDIVIKASAAVLYILKTKAVRMTKANVMNTAKRRDENLGGVGGQFVGALSNNCSSPEH